MNGNFRRWNSIWVGPAIAFAFLLMATYPRSAVAQSNTFPPTGNVGIGTTTPQRQLHLVHQSNGQAPLGIDEYAAAPDIRFRRAEGTIASPTAITINKTIGAITAAGYGATGFGTYRGLINFGASENWTDIAQGTFLSFFTTATGGTATSEKMRIDPSGNVGIGTASPGARLDIGGGNLRVQSGTLDLNNQIRDDSINLYGGYYTLGIRPWTFYAKTAQKFRFESGLGDSTQSAYELGSTAGATFLSVRNDGKVGIGTTAPGFKLDVQGGQLNASGGLCIAGVCKASWSEVGGGSSQWASEINSNISYNSGNVGIGTSSPASKLFVGSAMPAGGTLPGLNVALPGAAYMAASNGTVNTFVGSDVSSYGIVGTLSNHPLGLRANNTLVVTVLPSGKVGIGTPNPTKALDVVGDINVSGNINAKYQDLAEWVESSQELSASTLVVLDHTKPNQVIASSRAYDTRVAGVISARPGITLGESGDNKVLVATTGRVLLTVDASNGPIQIGDLLVTSDIAGVAMKSEAINVGGVQIHRPGTLIGKALEPLAKGQGKILVLLSLQ